jgi:hypothetical protein
MIRRLCFLMAFMLLSHSKFATAQNWQGIGANGFEANSPLLVFIDTETIAVNKTVNPLQTKVWMLTRRPNVNGKNETYQSKTLLTFECDTAKWAIQAVFNYNKSGDSLDYITDTPSVHIDVIPGTAIKNIFDATCNLPKRQAMIAAWKVLFDKVGPVQ